MQRFEEPDRRFGGHSGWRLESWKIWKSDLSIDRRQTERFQIRSNRSCQL